MIVIEAKADGDVSENAGYDEAKNTQAFVEGRILTLKSILSSAVVISKNGSKDRVDIGCTVTIHVEPCTPECTECPSPCLARDERIRETTQLHPPA